MATLVFQELELGAPKPLIAEASRAVVATPQASAADADDARELVQSPLARGDTGSALGLSKAAARDVDGEVTSPPAPAALALAAAAAAAAAAPADAALAAPPRPRSVFVAAEDLDASAEDPEDGGTPAWLAALFACELFAPCPAHPGVRKNEVARFCLACSPATGRALCRHCLPGHACGAGAPVIQARRYMYQSVVHVDDLAHRTSLAGVQAYCINARRACLVLPKPPAAGNGAGSGGGAASGHGARGGGAGAPAFANACRGCAVPLRPDCAYCSLKCKADAEARGGGAGPATPGASLFPGAAAAGGAGAFGGFGAGFGAAGAAGRRRRPPSAADSAAPAASELASGGGTAAAATRRKRCRPERSHEW